MITFVVFLTAASIAYILLMNPFAWYVIGGLIILLTVLSICLTMLVTKRRKWSFLAGLYICILLVLSYVLGFNLLNTILLTCFIIGLAVLLK